jgi:hypothetical protein
MNRWGLVDTKDRATRPTRPPQVRPLAGSAGAALKSHGRSLGVLPSAESGVDSAHTRRYTFMGYQFHGFLRSGVTDPASANDSVTLRFAITWPALDVHVQSESLLSLQDCQRVGQLRGRK